MHMCMFWITCHAHVHVLDYMYILLHVNNTSPYNYIAVHVTCCYGNQVLRCILYPCPS